MGKHILRIYAIEIENFKNVQHGKVELENRRKTYKASILGLYGQNGSGKTALIDAVQLLKIVLCGWPVPDRYADYINIDAASACLKYTFQMQTETECYDIWYQMRMRQVAGESSSNNDSGTDEPARRQVEIYDEVLEFAFFSEREKLRKNVLIDTRTGDIFVPKSKFGELLGAEQENILDMLLTKRLAKIQSRSFAFSKEMVNLFRDNCKNRIYMNVIEGLITFVHSELFIINTENSGWISMDTLPLAFKYREEESEMIGNLMLSLNEPASVREDALELLMKVIDNMNIVLKQIVPGLTIGFQDMGPALFPNGQTGRQLQMLSINKGRVIPFRDESEGIKKIVSILQLLIVVYNNSSITVAVDELDAGVFEYLLGEILKIISEKGKGQLIFTSHNLRPLETIDKGFIAFTTTNPGKRYIRMANVKGNHNLRDFYYRDIVLGEQSEPVYEPTNNYEIALAFREAGDAFGA